MPRLRFFSACENGHLMLFAEFPVPFQTCAFFSHLVAVITRVMSSCSCGNGLTWSCTPSSNLFPGIGILEGIFFCQTVF